MACCAAFVAPVTAEADGLPLRGFVTMAVDGANSQVFVAGGKDTTGIAVFGFDGRLIEVIEGFGSPRGLAVDGSNLYVSNSDGPRIDRIDTRTLEIAQSYDLGTLTQPGDLTVVDGLVWFVNGDCDAHDEAIAFLDPETGKVGVGDSDRNNMVMCGHLESTPAAPDTLFYWDSRTTSTQLSKYEITPPLLDGVTDPTLELVAETSLDDYGHIAEMAVSPGADRLAPLGYGSRFSELDSNLSPLTSYRGLQGGLGLAYSPDASRIAVAFNKPRGQINLYTPGTASAFGHIGLERPIVDGGLAYSPDGSRFFVITGTYTDVYESEVRLPYRLQVVDATRIDTELSLHTSRHAVKYGTRVQLTARLADDTSQRLVRFYSAAKGPDHFIDKARMSPSGVARLDGVPTKNATFFARWAGDSDYQPAKSNVVRIEVGVRIAGRIFGAYGQSGQVQADQ